MKISIASDHAGFEQKRKLAQYLSKCGHDVRDLGPENDARVDYPDFAERVARDVADDVARGKERMGVLVCGTGIGMAIAANKVLGIRAANVTTPEFAKLAREHNNANIVTLSGRFVEIDTNKEILDKFLNTPFAEGRHTDRVKKIMAIESEHNSGTSSKS